jgi:hypothetical protein
MSQKIPKIRVVSETDRSFTNDKYGLMHGTFAVIFLKGRRKKKVLERIIAALQASV